MTQDPAQASRPTTCPSCGAALRPGSPWCTLCYADLRPATPAAPMPAGVPTAPATHAAYGTAAPDPLTQPLLDFISAPPTATEQAPPPPPEAVAVASWPCTGCGSLNSFALSQCGACGAGFLAGTSDPPSLRLPLLGDIFQLSRAQRILAAAAAAIAIAVLLFAVLALLAVIVPG